MPDSQLTEAEEDWLLYSRGWRLYAFGCDVKLLSHPDLPDLYSRAAALLEIQSQGGA